MTTLVNPLRAVGGKKCPHPFISRSQCRQRWHQWGTS